MIRIKDNKFSSILNIKQSISKSEFKWENMATALAKPTGGDVMQIS